MVSGSLGLPAGLKFFILHRTRRGGAGDAAYQLGPSPMRIENQYQP